MSVSLAPPPPSYAAYLPDVYRFAFLMTGHATPAAEVLARTVERAARGGIGEWRDARQTKRWLFTEARQQCTRPLPPAAAFDDPAFASADHDASDTPVPDDNPTAEQRLARQFAQLPETERGALILFYLYLFDPNELAEVLEIPPADLAPLLNRGRALLGQGRAEWG